MPLPKELTTVTTLSKYLALTLFIFLPFLSFFIGINYQSMLDHTALQNAQLDRSNPHMVNTTSFLPNSYNNGMPSINPYLGWRQYCSKLEKSCFNYPPSWHLEIQEFTNPAEEALLTSPSGGNFAFNTPANEVDNNGCAITQEIHIDKVIPNQHVANLYIVEYGPQNNITHIALINGINGNEPSIGNTGQCVLQPVFKSKYPQSNFDNVSSFADSGSSIVPLKASDLPTAELMLESYTY